MSSRNDCKKSSSRSDAVHHGTPLLPILALLTAQLFTSSWHVLGKHVMHQVPYLAPISYVLLRTLISSLFLLFVGILHEGYVPFPPLFRDNATTRSFSNRGSSSSISLQAGLMKPTGAVTPSSSEDISLGLPISQSNSVSSLNGHGVYNGNTDKKVEDPILLQPKQSRRHHHRSRRKRRSRRFSLYVPSIWTILGNVLFIFRYYQQQMNNLNPEAVQIISAGLSGMLLLPTCYTTGLILTSPTVASVWDGPMIPLGCFCAAITLGLEKRSKTHPFGQVGSLLLTVGGSIVVLLVDYLGGGHGMPKRAGDDVIEINSASSSHIQFIRGNMVLSGLVASYSATALLQKRLNHYRPIQLTSWMFGIGFIGCFMVLLLDSVLGGILTGCTLEKALVQLYAAVTTSPTFRYGILYSAFFVGGACFSIASYASSHLESSVITLFAATQPPITAVLEWIWEGKGLGWKKIGGMACVGLGMHLFTHIKKLEKEEKIEQDKHNNHHSNHQSMHVKKSPQCYEHDKVKVSRGISDGNVTPSNIGSNSLMRKTMADV